MFTHLHLHTEYSLLDATIRISDLIEKLKESGMKSCAITDHGSMYGAFKFQNAMKAEGLKPIIGCEIYVAPRTMADKEHGIDNNYFHLVLLAKNLKGYKNLIKIVSVAHMEGFYYKPRIDFETLAKFSDNLIATSACLAGPISQPLLSNDYAKALEMAQKYSEIFKDNFYIEIQRNGMEEQNIVNEGLIKISKELNLPLVATCDSHYLNKEDAEIQEILWCISDGLTMDDPNRRRMPTNEFYVKTPGEMEKLFSDLPEAIENTQKIENAIEEYDISFERVETKYLDLPKGETAKSYLRKLAFEGVERKYGELTDDLKNRLEYELSIIHDKGYDDYFLVVRDFVQFCHEKDIVVGMRGSGCGSVVAYATDITSIEPLSWELYFERFLNPERPSPPDFDIDIADKRRDEVIQYTIEKYGIENVKQIGTFSKLQTRQAIRDVARVIGIDLKIADTLSKMVEIVFGKSKGIDYMIEKNPEFAEIINSSEETKHLAEIVRKISGLCRGVSTHACGIIITPQPVVEYCPIQRDAHNEGIGMTQYEMFDIEPLGLMKYDFLGLRNLHIIGAALQKIHRTTGEKIDLRKIDFNDKEVFDLIKSGNTVGIFQLESEGMKRTIRTLEPENLEDICYILAAYRPGPMQYITEYQAVKKGKQKPDYIFDELEPVLSVTKGVITYQEQVMKIAQVVAGYSLGKADVLRRAMGKKKPEVMQKEKPAFIQGAKDNGFDEDKVEKLWDKLLQFANYGFNKAHSASYATISYWTAYLKQHYPLQYMAALLEGDLEKFDRVILDLKECKRMGINVLPPNINKSGYYFTVDDKNNIWFGLGGIKNIGDDLVKSIISERDNHGDFQNLDDFVHRVFDKVNRKAIEYLIMAGAMDGFGNRLDLLRTLPIIYEKEKDIQKSSKVGQFDFFSLNNSNNQNKSFVASPLIHDTETDPNVILQWEKDLLGLYFSSHPLDSLQELFISKNVITMEDALNNKKNNQFLILGIMITKIRRITTKKGDNMAFLSIEDQTGKNDALVFPRVYEEIKSSLKENVPALLVGKMNVRNGEKSIVVEKVKIIDPTKHNAVFEGITFKITPEHSVEQVTQLKKYIASSKGDSFVRIIVNDGTKNSIVKLKKTIKDDSDTKHWMDIFPT